MGLMMELWAQPAHSRQQARPYFDGYNVDLEWFSDERDPVAWTNLLSQQVCSVFCSTVDYIQLKNALI